MSLLSNLIEKPELIIDGCITSDGIFSKIIEGLSENNNICGITLVNCKIGD